MDNWKHRSPAMKCRTCMWCVPKEPLVSAEGEPQPPTTLGRCRRHAPTMSGYPVVVLNGDWCGDHKLDENKI